MEINHSNDAANVISQPTSRTTMNGKPVLWRENTRTVITDPSHEFGSKLLCDSLVFNTGDACGFKCAYCYVKAVIWKLDSRIVAEHNKAHQSALDFHEVVIRRRNVLRVLQSQLLRSDGTRKYSDPEDTRVIYSSTLVDVAANMELLKETAAVCNLIFDNTHWQIRLLSKSSLLAKLVELVPENHHQRLIFGFSTGTLDDRVSRAVEAGTPYVRHRIEALHWLQDRGFRTFGMICPSLPQNDYEKFSRDICREIRVDQCEHVWAEPLNVRGQAMERTMEGLHNENLHEEADMLQAVHGPGAAKAWEQYARETFIAHIRNIPPEKLRFLQYIKKDSEDFWKPMREKGAVLLGEHAEKLGLCDTLGLSAPDKYYGIS